MIGAYHRGTVGLLVLAVDSHATAQLPSDHNGTMGFPAEVAEYCATPRIPALAADHPTAVLLTLTADHRPDAGTLSPRASTSSTRNPRSHLCRSPDEGTNRATMGSSHRAMVGLPALAITSSAPCATTPPPPIGKDGPHQCAAMTGTAQVATANLPTLAADYRATLGFRRLAPNPGSTSQMSAWARNLGVS